jgi:hypothetical protein
MEVANHKIPKDEHVYFSFRNEVEIRRELIPNDMIHLIICEYYEVYVHVLHYK